MRLSDLLYGLEYEVLNGAEDKEIESICYNSQNCRSGTAFFALKGRDADGHEYVSEAVNKGAEVIVADRASLGDEVTFETVASAMPKIVAVKDTREALAAASKNFFGKPDERMTVIGVTGTKGKTTTTQMIGELLEKEGHKVGIIGTLGATYGDMAKEFPNTTPESYQIYEVLAQMADAGCDVAVMEVSSQGLKYHRVDGIHFEIAVFTNIHVDHIGKGEHPTFSDYGKSKKMLFGRCGLAVVNRDDCLWEYMADCLPPDRIVSFSTKGPADFMADQIEYSLRSGRLGTDYICKCGAESFRVRLSVPGCFNVSNSLAAMAVCSLMGADLVKCSRNMEDIGVRGRTEIVEWRGFPRDYKVMVDYAHNGAALKALLMVLRVYAENRLVVVFGCGGQRDVRRRWEMGEAAARLADFSIVTSDNPRYENPEKIIGDIIGSMERRSGKFIAIASRREAIRYALANAEKGDIIVVAGKGHETYQLVGDRTLHFDDREEIIDFLKAQNADSACAGSQSAIRPERRT